MALDTDLSVDLLASEILVDLGEMLAPVSVFSTVALRDATLVGRQTVQMERRGTIPTQANNSADYQVTAGTNTNVAVTVNELWASQEITAQEQLQGIPFNTAVPGLVQSIGQGIWDDTTAIILTGTYGASVSGGAAGSFSVANSATMLTSIDSKNVSLLVENVEADAMMPSDKNSFQLSDEGAYGFASIHRVSNFTGATANTMAFACAPQAAVTVIGPPRRDPRVTERMRAAGTVEYLNIPQLGEGADAELFVWTDVQTKSLWIGLSICYGITAADANAGTMATHV